MIWGYHHLRKHPVCSNVSLQIASSSMIRTMTWVFFQMATPTQPEKACEKEMEDQWSDQPFWYLDQPRGLYPKQLLKNTIWLRWMPFFSCFFFGNKKTCTPNGKTHSCKGFSVPHVFCVNGLVDFHCHHIPSFVYGVLYFGGELWLSNFSLNSGIEDGVFAGCEQLEEVTFPTSLTHLGNYAFAESGTEETQLARTGKMYEFIDFSLSILVPFLIFCGVLVSGRNKCLASVVFLFFF